MAKQTAVSAPAVRAYFAEHPERIPEGDKSVQPKARGRLSPAAKARFAEDNPSQTYAEKAVYDNAKVTLVVVKQDAKGRKRTKKVEVSASQARTLAGDLAGKRGRLSEKALAAAAEAYAAQ